MSYWRIEFGNGRSKTAKNLSAACEEAQFYCIKSGLPPEHAHANIRRSKNNRLRVHYWFDGQSLGYMSY